MNQETADRITARLQEEGIPARSADWGGGFAGIKIPLHGAVELWIGSFEEGERIGLQEGTQADGPFSDDYIEPNIPDTDTEGAVAFVLGYLSH